MASVSISSFFVLLAIHIQEANTESARRRVVVVNILERSKCSRKRVWWSQAGL
jgi:hypothetical protein